MGLSRASTPDRTAANAMRAAETSRRPARSRSRPPQCASQPKLRSTTKHDETLLLGVPLDHAMAHAVPVRPFLAALGNKGAVEDGFTQAGPFCLARIQGGKRVALLGGRRHHGHGKPSAVGIDQGHALAPQHLLGRVIPTWATNRDAFDRLRVDDTQAGFGLSARSTTPQAGHVAQQAVEQPQLQPSPAKQASPRNQPYTVRQAGKFLAERAKARRRASARRSR